ncbi:hypothetical protein [Laspinema olomoucense]|uniref:hypothetical protein n=1 Tax=Laspinema olomoucense TaxID=3231600 RepID=UPI0021BB7271|nr:hypothetical protein [Laspinema sp. D3d]MCT7975257.1 hypothetical protein [Laspinema sp. D3d]
MNHYLKSPDSNCEILGNTINFDEIVNSIDYLTIEQKALIAQKIVGDECGLSVVLNSPSLINQSAIQVNGNPHQMVKELKSLSGDALAELLWAIGCCIKQQ